MSILRIALLGNSQQLFQDGATEMRTDLSSSDLSNHWLVYVLEKLTGKLASLRPRLQRRSELQFK